MQNNIRLLDYSFAHPEPLVDDFYIKEGSLIISESPDKPNKLMEINRSLLDNITAFRVAAESENSLMQKQILLRVESLIKEKGINYSEFASFWSVIDVSYSTFNSLAHTEQLTFLRLAIEKYLEMRHNLYQRHGYTATTLQVGKDAKSHKSSGSLGISKAAYILREYHFKQLDERTISSFKKNDRIYIFTDKTGKALFKEILKTFKIKLSWSSDREKKMPDLLFKNGDDLYIVEHKHMKEGGGGQDKQANEVISFVGYTEETPMARVHYVSFLDGLYFNFLAARFSSVDTKIRNQAENIRKNLESHPNNYFVDTAGFRELLSHS